MPEQPDDEGREIGSWEGEREGMGMVMGIHCG
jgi:hypothetical protein